MKQRLSGAALIAMMALASARGESVQSVFGRASTSNKHRCGTCPSCVRRIAKAKEKRERRAAGKH